MIRPSTATPGSAAPETTVTATITAFFDTYGHDRPREWLWELLKAAMASEQSAAWSSTTRGDYMLFCERLAGMIDACSGVTSCRDEIRLHHP